MTQTHRIAITFALVCLCPAIPILAAEDSDVLFFAPFEGGIDAVLAQGEAAAKATGKPGFEAGVRGKAVKIDPESLLSYAFKGNVVPDEGTIMMWVKPGWDASDNDFHNLFRASTGNHGGKSLNTIMLYKYPRWSRLLLYTSNSQQTDPREGKSMAFRNEIAWKAGEWAHVAGTWSATLANIEMILYFNGERAAACGGAVYVPDQAPERFEIGGPRKSNGTTWFDDLLVLSRPLTAAEVKSVYDGYGKPNTTGPAELPFASDPDLQLRPHVLFTPGKVVVLVDYRSARRELGKRAGRVKLQVEGAAGRTSAESTTDASGLTRVTIDYASVGAGNARLSAELFASDGRKLRKGELTWAVPAKPDWVGNDLGKSEEVPPPWTPLRIDRDSVSLWGREYKCKGSPLPTQVTTQGRDVLRAPVTMKAKVAGKPAILALRSTGPYQGSDAVQHRHWQGEFGPMACTVSSRVEFDGFLLLDMEFDPGPSTRLDSLELVMPMRSDGATLYHHCNGVWNDLSDAGAIGEPGWRKPLEFVPFVWLGTDEGGLAWFCEHNQGRSNADESRAIEILRQSDGVDLVVRFVDEAIELDGPLHLTFGFMATPVKAMPEGWRSWRPMFTSALHVDKFMSSRWADPGTRAISVLYNNHVGSFSYYPADPALMGSKVAMLRKNAWDDIVSYYALNQTQVGTPVYNLLEREWRRNPYGEQTAAKWSYSTVCAASNWADFLMHAINETMDQTGTDGVYLDCSNPRFCKSVEHGCAPGRHPLLATRELYKRIYTLVHQKRSERGFVYAHMSESHFITSYAFADAVLNGEQYNRKDLRMLTNEKFRAELSPGPYGVPTFLLPTLVKFQPEKREKIPGAQFLAFPLLHDTICVPQWMNRESQQLLRRIHTILFEFGVADAEFLPYWSNQSEVMAAHPDVKVSAYLRPDGRAAMLIGQRVGGAASVDVTLGGRLASLHGKPAKDALTGTALIWREGKLEWPMADREAQIVIVGP